MQPGLLSESVETEGGDNGALRDNGPHVAISDQWCLSFLGCVSMWGNIPTPPWRIRGRFADGLSQRKMVGHVALVACNVVRIRIQEVVMCLHIDIRLPGSLAEDEGDAYIQIQYVPTVQIHK